MGLDMYAMTTTITPDAPVDFTIADDIPVTRLYYWRKHPDLHGWMEQLYRAKGGIEAAFNGDKLVLTLADLDALETAVRGQSLPYTVGFFFGESEPEFAEDDLEFIAKARDAIRDGLTVYYDSWW